MSRQLQEMTIVAAAHVHWRVTSDAHHSATTHARCRSRTRTDGIAPRAANRGLSAMTKCSDDHHRDFGRDTDHNLRRARVAGYVLLAGLFLEVVSYIIWFHGIETLASMACVALVAGGVARRSTFVFNA